MKKMKFLDIIRSIAIIKVSIIAEELNLFVVITIVVAAIVELNNLFTIIIIIFIDMRIIFQ